MIQLVHQRCERGLDVPEIDQPPRGIVDIAFAGHLDPKTVPVQPSALVPGRHVGQPMGSLEREFADHANPSPRRQRPLF